METNKTLLNSYNVYMSYKGGNFYKEGSIAGSM